MATIFPGMDPYLEDPQIWPGVHSRFIVYMADRIQASLSPRYVTAVDERVYLQGPDRWIAPDVLVSTQPAASHSAATAVVDADERITLRVPDDDGRETYVTILDLENGQHVVTVIELVSPTNKYAGPGQVSYLTKQREVRASDANLVEIDLLRHGPHVLAVAEQVVRRRRYYDYLISVNRAQQVRDEYEVYLRTLRDRLPRISIPLAAGDPDVVLDLQEVLDQTYEAGRYRTRLAYDKPCHPSLSDADQAWANELIQKAAASK